LDVSSFFITIAKRNFHYTEQTNSVREWGMYEKAHGQTAKCAQIKLRFFSKLHFLCSVRLDRQRDGERAVYHTVRRENMAERKRKKKKKESENSRHTVSDNLVVSTLLF
jgi:hypothetical protein